MSITHASFYLPITDRVLAPVLDEARTFEDAIVSLPVPQVAALLLLQSLPKFNKQSTASLDRALYELIGQGNIQARSGSAADFARAAAQSLSRNNIRDGHRLLADFGIALLDDDALLHRDYLTIDGEWDSAFRQRQEARRADALQRVDLPMGGQGILTTEQSRIFREMRAQTDDHMHVQGYAGTGKSYLIRSLLMLLQRAGAEILVLAERQRQLDALLAGMGEMEHVSARRFDRLIGEMVPPNRMDPSTRRLAQTSFSLAPIGDDLVIRHLGIQASGEMPPRQIVRIVRSTVIGFCYSGDDSLDVQHIPKWAGASLDHSTRQVILHHATELWKATLLPPSRDFQPPVRSYHRVKCAALNGWQIPARYTHVLIDECHDLSKSMLQILDRSPQVVISLGDEYQNLQGRPQQRSHIVRQRAVTASVRSGRLIEELVNPIIAVHPGRTKLPFHGNPLHRTELVFYDKPQIPDRPAAILVSDLWSLFEWTQRLATENLDIELLSSQDDLDMFVRDCIELYKNGTRPRHGDLFRFARWDAVSNRHYDNPGFQRIDRMLRNGYGDNDWLKACARFVKPGLRSYALGLVESARNREFESVMLSPDVVGRVFTAENAALAAASSAVYVAVTRAKSKLIAPMQLRNWIEELSASQSRHKF